ncbi:MAG: LysM peptidoglycan-binding domain-containing protein, partial [Acidimicrobiia bacterium]|nr:LysM peptidoglycan-binding domain-containing protein [Acidimicrobiia bacterium]
MVHVVQPGETLGAIARKFGSTVAAFLAANPQVPNGDVIFPGQELTVPDAHGDAAPEEPVPQAGYIVRSGDTMRKIADHFGVSLAELLAANPQIPNPDRIRPGDPITVPGGRTMVASRVTAP